MSDENGIEPGSAEPDNPTVEPADTQAELDYEKQYKALLPEYTRSQQTLKDREAWLAHGQENFPDVFVDEEEELDDEVADVSDDEPEVMTKAEFKEWQAEQTAEKNAAESNRQFAADVEQFRGDRELNDKARLWLASQYRDGTIKGTADTEKAIGDWFAYEDELSGGKKAKKNAPHVLSGGKAATGVPNYGDMTEDQAVEAMVDRARSLDTQM